MPTGRTMARSHSARQDETKLSAPTTSGVLPLKPALENPIEAGSVTGKDEPPTRSASGTPGLSGHGEPISNAAPLIPSPSGHTPGAGSSMRSPPGPSAGAASAMSSLIRLSGGAGSEMP